MRSLLWLLIFNFLHLFHFVVPSGYSPAQCYFEFWEKKVKSLEEEMAAHSSILAWRIPWMEDPGRLQSMGSQRVRHGWATNTSVKLTQNCGRLGQGGAVGSICVTLLILQTKKPPPAEHARQSSDENCSCHTPLSTMPDHGRKTRVRPSVNRADISKLLFSSTWLKYRLIKNICFENTWTLHKTPQWKHKSISTFKSIFLKYDFISYRSYHFWEFHMRTVGQKAHTDLCHKYIYVQFPVSPLTSWHWNRREGGGTQL